MNRNLALYDIYRPMRRALVWMPVFFLYFGGRFSVDRVLALEAIYYFSVVVMEVPSGYFSDRVGRVRTLRIGTVCLIGSHVLFLSGGSSFVVFALAQALLAAAFAFQSGTDTSFHYDTLTVLDRTTEFARR